jgi:hypothetical protein
MPLGKVNYGNLVSMSKKTKRKRKPRNWFIVHDTLTDVRNVDNCPIVDTIKKTS